MFIVILSVNKKIKLFKIIGRIVGLFKLFQARAVKNEVTPLQRDEVGSYLL